MTQLQVHMQHTAPEQRAATTPLLDSMSARYAMSKGQGIFIGVCLLVVILGALIGVTLQQYLQWVIGVMCVFYFSTLIYDLGLVVGALRLPKPGKAADSDSPDTAELPRYTVMVALYKEAAVIEQLVRNLSQLQYPVEKLEVLLLLEEDDEATVRRARSLSLPAHFRVVLVPVSQPRTKPKALNYGLSMATGDLITIYDAEDCPEPTQLLKAVQQFRESAADVVCLQAKLVYQNTRTNLLTRLFTAEYAKAFHLYTPGLSANDLIVPLGGTSNHFRAQALREMGMWDAYNVTEDADLGVRIARMGGRIGILDSVTYESATSRVYSWVKQRSRWIKGYMQTYLVHMRNPLLLVREVGIKRYLGLQITLGVSPFLLLVNPFFWALTVVYFATRSEAIEALFPPVIMLIGIVSMVLGNLISIYYMLVGAMIQKEYSVVKYMLLVPAYWVLMSVAAWRAFIQLIFKPHYWEKTMHEHAAQFAPAPTLTVMPVPPSPNG